MMDDISFLYQAIKENKKNNIQYLLNHGVDVNSIISTTGTIAGYTALHVACLEGNITLVELFIKGYYANVNAIGDDKAQPIHLACLLKYPDIVRILLEAHADVEAKIGKDLYLKYSNDRGWSNDFDEKITLITFAILNDTKKLFEVLLKYKANS